jgi:hypothetical protein
MRIAKRAGMNKAKVVPSMALVAPVIENDGIV